MNRSKLISSPSSPSATFLLDKDKFTSAEILFLAEMQMAGYQDLIEIDW